MKFLKITNQNDLQVLSKFIDSLDEEKIRLDTLIKEKLKLYIIMRLRI